MPDLGGTIFRLLGTLRFCGSVLYSLALTLGQRGVNVLHPLRLGDALGHDLVDEPEHCLEEAWIVAHVGKEANKLKEVEFGLERDPEVTYTEYIWPGQISWRSAVLPVLKLTSARQLADATRLAMSTVNAARNGHPNPHGQNRQARIRAAAVFARERLRE